MAFLTNQAASSSSFSSSFTRCQYDVFLNFRGKDTSGFIGHLYQALCEKDLNTFIDNSLSSGEEIFAELLKVIDDLTIFIIVFSENYLFSSWCLEKLAKIIDVGRIVRWCYQFFTKWTHQKCENNRESSEKHWLNMK